MGGVNAKIKYEIPAEKQVDKLNDTELVITPKKEFLEWFRNTKVIIDEIKVKQKENGVSLMECPNCKSKMLDYDINLDPGELWHLCTKCNISFSQTQHRYSTKMIMRLINEDI